jgi:diacylglycerol kinase (ATP)
MQAADLCVIFNPTAGRRRLSEHLERFRRVFGNGFAPLPTQRAGHAEELAFDAARAGCRVVAAAGGDGTVHEVANGLLRAERNDVALAVWPVGSANDFAFSLGLDADGWLRPDAPPLDAVDIGVVRSPDGRQRYFVNGLGLGFNGAVTLESRRIRWLQGLPLYSLALLRALCWHFVHPRMRVTLDGKLRETPTLALTVNLGHREGGFVMAPRAVLDDGWFDYLHAGPLRRWELLRYFPAIVTGKLPEGHPSIWTGRCQLVQVESELPLTVHLDGEFFCLTEDRVRQIELEILPRRLRVRRDSRP